VNTSIAKDSSPNNRNATFVGNISKGQNGLVTGSVRSIIMNSDFTQNNVVSAAYGSYLNLPGDFTFELASNAIANQTGTTPALVYIPYAGNIAQPQMLLYIDPHTSSYAFRISTTEQTFVEVQSSVIADGTNYLITARRSGNRLSLFINGQEEASAVATGTNLLSTSYGLNLGGQLSGTPNVSNYVGGLDVFSLYGTALADSDIFKHWAAISYVDVTPSPTPTLSVTPTITPSKTPPVSGTPAVSVTPSVTATVSVTASVSVTVSVTPSVTHSVSPSVTPSVSPTPTPSTT
jgi:hypothetical protein